MGTRFIIEMVVNILRSFLFKSNKAAPYAKYLLRARDYLLLLFPLDQYPENSTGDPALSSGIKVDPVKKADVKSAAKKEGFSLPLN